MNMLPFTFAGVEFLAMSSGALWWPEERTLVVADLHLGKSERMARRGGTLLPPYEVNETLDRLKRDIAQMDPARVICLGDSFDDAACEQGLSIANRATLESLQSERKWVWVTGNHDPQLAQPGCVDDLQIDRLIFRHIAKQPPLPTNVVGEVSGHYHPKHSLSTRGGRVARKCFLVTDSRIILPAYGLYTGGLSLSDQAFTPLLSTSSKAILVAEPPIAVPLSIQAAAE